MFSSADSSLINLYTGLMTYVLHSQQSECRFLQVGTGRRGKKVTKNDNKTITETIRFHLNEAPAEHLPPGTRLVLLLPLPPPVLLPPPAATAACSSRCRLLLTAGGTSVGW